MKIPKKIQNIIDRRERLAMELLDVCEKLDSLLEKNVAEKKDKDIAYRNKIFLNIYFYN